MTGKSIGIDLGTTQSSAAFHHIKTINLKNIEGQDLTPSCVSATKGKKPADSQFLVGKSALDWMQQDPSQTVRSIKRLLGRSFSDPSVQKIIQENRVTYRIQAAQDNPETIVVILNSKEYLPEDISAEILKKIKHDAQIALEAPVATAVVTVPAFFNDKQKNATRVACNKANLELLRLLPEPTAAAISFGLDLQGQDGGQVLVFDFGGGTLDLCLLAISGNQFLEIGKGGDSWLGGDDIDQMLIEHIFATSEKNDGLEAGTLNKWFQAMPQAGKSKLSYELKRKAEQAKIELSTKQTVTVDVLGVLTDENGELVNIEAEITRKDFEKMIAPVVHKSIDLTEDLLDDLHFTKEDITKVLLVGGSSQIPLIQSALKDFFGAEKIVCHERPLLAIAEGASILAQKLSQTEVGAPKDNFGIIHTASHDYILELKDGQNALLVERNTPLPCQVRREFTLVSKDQVLINLKFANAVGDEHQQVGNLWLSIDDDIEKLEKEKIETLVVDFSIDENNLIQVFAFLKDAPKVRIAKTISRGHKDEILFNELENVIQLAKESSITYWTGLETQVRAQFLTKQLNGLIDPNTHDIDQNLYTKSVAHLEVTRELIKKQKSIYPTIYFAETMIKDFGRYFKSKDDVESLMLALKNAKIQAESGSLEEIETALLTLGGEISQNHFPQFLTHAESAIHEKNQTDAPGAQRLANKLASLLAAVDLGNLKLVKALSEELSEDINELPGLTTKKFEIETAIQEGAVS